MFSMEWKMNMRMVSNSHKVRNRFQYFLFAVLIHVRERAADLQQTNFSALGS
jgi:hypothetical protein